MAEVKRFASGKCILETSVHHSFSMSLFAHNINKCATFSTLMISVNVRSLGYQAAR